MNEITQSRLVDAEDYDRSRYIGGSDIASLLGINPWKSAVQVFMKKTRQDTEPEREKPIWKRGKRWEGAVTEMLVEELEAKGHHVEIVASNHRYRDAEHPMFAAEIDFEIRLDHEPDITNVEAKTVTPFATNKWGDSGSDDMPVWYTAQCMWGLGVAPGQRKRSILAALFGADELRTYPVMREEPVIQKMREHALAFWNCYVLTKTAPPPVNIADVQLLFPEQLKPYVIATPEIEEAYLQLVACKAQIKASEAEIELHQFRVMKFMRDAGGLLIGASDKPAITWMQRNQSSFDFDWLRANHPKIFKQFQKSGKARPFIVR